MHFLKKYHEFILLGLILIGGTILRFYNLSDRSLTNDELSALIGVNKNSVHDALQQYVSNDVHPAGVELFLFYWARLFDDSEFALRFPFAVCGILSIFLTYLIAEKWFGKLSALFTATSVGFLQFTILYSQLARPYSPGLFFSLTAVYCWTQVLFFHKNKINWWYFTGWVFSACLCTYIHYFAFLFIFIVGLSGLFFLTRKNYLYYLLSGLVIFILYLPHFSIFMKQFGYGGLGWLPAPGKEFLSNFIFYSFNQSYWVLYSFLLICLWGMWQNRKTVRWTKFHSLSLFWFFAVFGIGYLKSILDAPVLQNPALLFCFPYLLMFGFSFFSFTEKNISFKSNYGKALVMLVLFMVICILSLLFEKKYYQTNPFPEFKKIAQKIIDWNNKYGKANITMAQNANSPTYLDYYFQKYNNEFSFVQSLNENSRDLIRLDSVLKNCQTAYFLYAWTNIKTIGGIDALIRKYFPVILQEETYFYSSAVLYSKDALINKKILFHTINDFENKNENVCWNNFQTLTDEQSHSGNMSSKTTREQEFGTIFSLPLDTFDSLQNMHLRTSVWCLMQDTDTYNYAKLVVSIDAGGKSIQWNDVLLNKYVTEPFLWKKVFLEYLFPAEIKNGAVVKIFIWNKGTYAVYADDFEITFF